MLKGRWTLKDILREVATTILLILVLGAVIGFFRNPSLPSDDLPGLKVRMIDRRVFEPAKGHVVVLHFWGTWCSVCRMEAPNIDFLARRYDVLTFAVNSGSDRAITAFLKDRNLSYNVVNDAKGSWARRFRISAFPTTFIYDGDGKLRFTEVGYTTTLGLLARVWLAGLF